MLHAGLRLRYLQAWRQISVEKANKILTFSVNEEIHLDTRWLLRLSSRTEMLSRLRMLTGGAEWK